MDNPNIATPPEECAYCKALETINDPSEGSCPYCAQMDEEIIPNIGDCKYCADMADDAPCKYCDAMNAEPASAGCAYCADMAHRDQECQYCGEAPNTKNPTTTDSEDFAGQDLRPPAIPKPIPGQDPQDQAVPLDDSTVNNRMFTGPGDTTAQMANNTPILASDQPPEGVQVDHSKEAMMNIASQIEDSSGIADGIGSGPGLAGATTEENTDQADMTVSTTMEDNISRPGGYDQENDADMGTTGSGPQDDGRPDLTSVLHEGLDAHAQNIQREKVVQMTSQALQGFKACKQIIERAQQEAPQLYQSSIMMLRAMIEMCKMLGLDQEGAPSQDENPLDPESGNEWDQPFATHPDQGGTLQPGHALSNETQTASGDANTGSEWNEPFATHPDQGGQAKPGHAPSTVGQPVGKLPTSATTEHIPKVPITPGSVNANGQMRYVDPKTGKESFIDMKEGRVLSPTGKPVKPPMPGKPARPPPAE